jgi:hypothetical protein
LDAVPGRGPSGFPPQAPQFGLQRIQVGAGNADHVGCVGAHGSSPPPTAAKPEIYQREDEEADKRYHPTCPPCLFSCGTCECLRRLVAALCAPPPSPVVPEHQSPNDGQHSRVPTHILIFHQLAWKDRGFDKEAFGLFECARNA